MAVVRHKEAIHSGHFMVSNFDADDQDGVDFAVPVSLAARTRHALQGPLQVQAGSTVPQTVRPAVESSAVLARPAPGPVLQPDLIERDLTKLFHCMSIAYRQKLTSPKWNRYDIQCKL